METKSKLNTVLLIIIIILFVAGLGYILLNNSNKKIVDIPDNVISQNNNVSNHDDSIKINNSIEWMLIPGEDGLVFYNTKWEYQRNLNGEHYAYTFTLPSGNYLNWAYTGQPCVEDNKKFEYGVSDSVCVKGWTTWLGVADVKIKNTKEDFNALGDFVLKNQ